MRTAYLKTVSCETLNHWLEHWNHQTHYNNNHILRQVAGLSEVLGGVEATSMMFWE